MQKYYIEIMEKGKLIAVEVSKEVYDFWNCEEKRLEEKLKKSDQRHLDKKDLEDVLITYKKGSFISEKIIHNELLEELNKIISSCTEKQQRRFHLNKTLGYSFVEIGKMENCTKQSVKESVDVVSAKLKKLKKNKFF